MMTSKWFGGLNKRMTLDNGACVVGVGGVGRSRRENRHSDEMSRSEYRMKWKVGSEPVKLVAEEESVAQPVRGSSRLDGEQLSSSGPGTAVVNVRTGC
jgi:hypothetical protein